MVGTVLAMSFCMLATTYSRPVNVTAQNIDKAMEQIHSLTASAVSTKNIGHAERVFALSRGVYAYTRKAGPEAIGYSIHVQTRMAQLKSAGLVKANATLV